jgi:subtilisin-like proprotein convertase family protein
MTGLSDCTTYYYWVESTDTAGNVAASNSGGGTFAFTTGHANQASLTSTDTPLPIPDLNGTGVTSTIAVASSSVVLDVNATVNITHTYDSDLTLTLITPAATTISLASHRGGSGDDFRNTVFDDEATTPIGSGAPPFSGSFKPEGLLSVADGASGAGNWKFKVVDSVGQDSGTIDSWTLNLVYPPSTCAPSGAPPPVPDGSFGTGMTVAALPAAKNYHLVYGPLQSVASYAPAGGLCGLGPSGGYDWTNVPAGDLWFLVVSDDAASQEGSWGVNGTGAERNGGTASGFCGFATRNNAGTCP